MVQKHTNEKHEKAKNLQAIQNRPFKEIPKNKFSDTFHEFTSDNNLMNKQETKYFKCLE